MKVRDSVKMLCESLFRWVPSPVEPCLKVFGNPDKNSPVFLTCNYDLTVRRVSKHLRGLDCYLLVAQSKGINVWCASCGGDFTEFSVISAIKTSGINNRVSHRVLIAPQLSAPGIDVKKVKEETGWNIRFGPVYARDIPAYVENNFRKSEKMRLVKFNLKDRIEMATIYFATIGLLISIPSLILFPHLYLSSILLAGLETYLMYMFFPYFLLKSGFAKVFLGESLIVFVVASFSMVVTGNPLGFPHLMIVSAVVTLVIGVDFNGTSSTHESDLGKLFYRHGHKRMLFLTGVHRLNPYGNIHIDEDRCSGCAMCHQVCPKGVYEMDFNSHKAKIVQVEECVNCSACVRQCPEQCLTIVGVSR